MADPEADQIKTFRDFMANYNKLSETCFADCIWDFTSRFDMIQMMFLFVAMLIFLQESWGSRKPVCFKLCRKVPENESEDLN